MFFRGHLRDCMVECVMARIEGKNCKDDMDNYLFSLDTLQSSGSNFTIQNSLETDIPESIRDLMHTSVTPGVPHAHEVPDVADLTPDKRLTHMERNIVSYIGGYILEKLIKKAIPCTELKLNLQMRERCWLNERSLLR